MEVKYLSQKFYDTRPTAIIIGKFREFFTFFQLIKFHRQKNTIIHAFKCQINVNENGITNIIDEMFIASSAGRLLCLGLYYS